jgi:hypothetical protein
MGEPFSFTHSAEVQIWLDCDGYGRVELSRVTPKSVVAKTALFMPACFADLVVMVDGQRISNRVRVTSGFSNRAVALVRPVSNVAPF